MYKILVFEHYCTKYLAHESLICSASARNAIGKAHDGSECGCCTREAVTGSVALLRGGWPYGTVSTP